MTQGIWTTQEARICITYSNFGQYAKHAMCSYQLSAVAMSSSCHSILHKQTRGHEVPSAVYAGDSPLGMVNCISYPFVSSLPSWHPECDRRFSQQELYNRPQMGVAQCNNHGHLWSLVHPSEISLQHTPIPSAPSIAPEEDSVHTHRVMLWSSIGQTG